MNTTEVRARSLVKWLAVSLLLLVVLAARTFIVASDDADLDGMFSTTAGSRFVLDDDLPAPAKEVVEDLSVEPAMPLLQLQPVPQPRLQPRTLYADFERVPVVEETAPFIYPVSAPQINLMTPPKSAAALGETAEPETASAESMEYADEDAEGLPGSVFSESDEMEAYQEAPPTASEPPSVVAPFHSFQESDWLNAPPPVEQFSGQEESRPGYDWIEKPAEAVPEKTGGLHGYDAAAFEPMPSAIIEEDAWQTPREPLPEERFARRALAEDETATADSVEAPAPAAPPVTEPAAEPVPEPAPAEPAPTSPPAEASPPPAPAASEPDAPVAMPQEQPAPASESPVVTPAEPVVAAESPAIPAAEPPQPLLPSQESPSDRVPPPSVPEPSPPVAPVAPPPPPPVAPELPAAPEQFQLTPPEEAFSGPELPADCCLACPRTWYANVSAFYLNRNSRSGVSLVDDDPNPLDNVGYELGSRVTIGRIRDCCEGFEVSYIGPHKWTETSVLTAGNIQATFVADGVDVSTFRQAQQTTQELDVELHSLEVMKKCWGWDVIATSFGVRYMDLREELTFDSVDLIEDATGAFDVQTHNKLIGPQIGLDLFVPIGRWTSSLRGKAGLYANFVHGEMSLTNADVLQFANNDDETQFAFEGEIGYFLSYRVLPKVTVVAGYELWYLWGVATVFQQTMSPLSPTSGTSYVTDDDIFMHGGTLGVEVVW